MVTRVILLSKAASLFLIGFEKVECIIQPFFVFELENTKGEIQPLFYDLVKRKLSV